MPIRATRKRRLLRRPFCPLRASWAAPSRVPPLRLWWGIRTWAFKPRPTSNDEQLAAAMGAVGRRLQSAQPGVARYAPYVDAVDLVGLLSKVAPVDPGPSAPEARQFWQGQDAACQSAAGTRCGAGVEGAGVRGRRLTLRTPCRRDLCRALRRDRKRRPRPPRSAAPAGRTVEASFSFWRARCSTTLA